MFVKKEIGQYFFTELIVDVLVFYSEIDGLESEIKTWQNGLLIYIAANKSNE